MKRISIFCGSTLGTSEEYQKQAYLLGQSLAKLNIGIVYGGANIGLMGAVADGSIDDGGEVIGILPNFLKGREIAHQNLTELILVETMHERKTKMNELSDGAIALPGGFGTLEELFEMLTWGTLGLHAKPIGLLNINGFYDSLINLFHTMVQNGFLKEEKRNRLLVSDNIDDLLSQIQNYMASSVEKQITQETT